MSLWKTFDSFCPVVEDFWIIPCLVQSGKIQANLFSSLKSVSEKKIGQMSKKLFGNRHLKRLKIEQDLSQKCSAWKDF